MRGYRHAGFPESALSAFTLGCDLIHVAREAMAAIFTELFGYENGAVRLAASDEEQVRKLMRQLASITNGS